jgi:hypothetical protein
MRITVSILAAAAMLAASAESYNPLQDYREVEPNKLIDPPQPGTALPKQRDPERVARGQYLVSLLNCAVCHTDGALLGAPELGVPLAGSTIGIAFSDPLRQKYPGVLYPPNLTPDLETGLGSWNDEQLVAFIRSGTDPAGRRHMSVMPWPAFSKMTVDDTQAIVDYLKSLEPVKFSAPPPVQPGQKARHPFVHFGVYQSRDQ